MTGANFSCMSQTSSATLLGSSLFLLLVALMPLIFVQVPVVCGGQLVNVVVPGELLYGFSLEVQRLTRYSATIVLYCSMGSELTTRNLTRGMNSLNS